MPNSKPHDERYATRWQTAYELPRGLVGTLRWKLRGLYLDIVSAVPISIPDRFLKCLCCHYVFDDQVAEFEALIQELKTLGTFIHARECVELARGQRRLNGRFFHLTFDDGFRNVVQNAFPILTRHEVPATFFVPSAMVGADFRSAEQFCRRERYQRTVEFATWDDLRSLDPDLFTVGSHTRNHPRLSEISADADRLQAELAGSKADIEQQLDRPCTLLAWPRGQRNDIDETALTVAKQSGYEAAFGAFGGSVVTGDPNAFVIPRQHFEVQWPLRHVIHLSKSP